MTNNDSANLKKMSLRERNTNEKNLQEPSDKKSHNFLFVFYPDDDKHMKILSMLKRYPRLYRVVYILHDKDCWSDDDIIKYKNEHDGECPYNAGVSKKPHIHCVCNYKSLVKASSFSQKIGGTYCMICNDIYGTLQYFIHDTPDSWHKFQYGVDKLCGDEKYISLLSQQNGYYIQLQTLCHLFDSEHGLRSVIDYVAENPQYQETFERFQYLIVACNVDERSRCTSNQLINNYRGYNNETKNQTRYIELLL